MPWGLHWCGAYKVIIEKSRGGRFLWKISEIWAGFGPDGNTEKKLGLTNFDPPKKKLHNPTGMNKYSSPITKYKSSPITKYKKCKSTPGLAFVMVIFLSLAFLCLCRPCYCSRVQSRYMGIRVANVVAHHEKLLTQ